MRGILWFPKKKSESRSLRLAWTILDSVTGPHSWGPPKKTRLFGDITFSINLHRSESRWPNSKKGGLVRGYDKPRLIGVASHRSLPGGMISYTHRIHGTGKLFTSRKMKIKHLWLDKYAIHQWIHHGIWFVSNMGFQCEVCQDSSR